MKQIVRTIEKYHWSANDWKYVAKLNESYNLLLLTDIYQQSWHLQPANLNITVVNS